MISLFMNQCGKVAGLIWVILLAGSCLGAEPVGLVLDVQGKVNVNSGAQKSWVTLPVLSYLVADQDVILVENSKMVATVHAAKSEYSFAGPARLRVDQHDITVIQGAMPSVRQLSADVVKACSTLNPRFKRGGVVMRTLTPRLEPTDGTAVISNQPTLLWRTTADSALLIVLRHGDGREIFRTQVTQPSGAVTPPMPLNWGEHYQWSVALASDPNSKPLASTSFYMVTQAIAKRLQAQQPSPDARRADHVLYALVLQEAGAVDEARRILDRVPEIEVLRNTK